MKGCKLRFIRFVSLTMRVYTQIRHRQQKLLKMSDL